MNNAILHGRDVAKINGEKVNTCVYLARWFSIGSKKILKRATTVSIRFILTNSSMFYFSAIVRYAQSVETVTATVRATQNTT